MKMKKKFRRIISIMIVFLVICVMTTVIHYHNTKNAPEKLVKVSIEEVLKTKAYNYLPEKAKDYIRDVYYEDGYVLLTEKNKEKDKEYLNPEFIKYLESDEAYAVIPSATVVDFVPIAKSEAGEFPAKFDLRDVDGKNYVTPFKNQGREGLCWDFATNAHLESHLLVKNNKSYDSTATILSEQQLDYAASNNGSVVENKLYNFLRPLSEGGGFGISENLMLDGMIVVKNDWDDAHTTEIENKSPIERADIFNFDNSLYELNQSYNFPAFNYLAASESERTSYLNSIKDNIMKYGGGYISTDVCYDSINMYNGERTKVVDVMDGGGCIAPGPHALQLIGWDDDFEWMVCKKSHGYANPPQDCGTAGYASGKGVWILKNSWGNQQSIVLLAYESRGTDIDFVADLGERNWDNFYKTDKTYVNSTTATYKFKSNAYVSSEQLKKIKVVLGQNTTNQIYLNDSKIGEITTTYKGYYTLDVSDKNLAITKDSVIKLVTTGAVNSINDLRLYTSNSNTRKSVLTEDIVYDASNEHFNSSQYFDFYLYTQTKNLPNYTELTFRIKDSSGNYLPNGSYSYEYNKVYANTGYTKLTIDSNYFSKGLYTIETYYDETHRNTSKFNINVDLLITEGDGSSENPWKIYSTRQFNTIRNNLDDAYILMNDLDFEYDTQNGKGLYYNGGLGFEAIDNFNGFLDGNGYQIKNLYSKSKIGNSNGETRAGGIFDSAYFSNCKLEQCGFKNIIISNPDITGAYSTGGFVNSLSAYENDKFVFENISVIGGNVSNLVQPTYQIGGIVGSFYPYADANKVVSIKNLYSSANVKGNSNANKVFNELIGGVIGVVGGESEGGTISISNLMFEGTLSHSTYYKKISGTVNIEGGFMMNLHLDNVISLNKDYDAVGISPEIEDYSDEFTMSINNVYTTANVGFDEETAGSYLDSSSNIVPNQSIFEIANADYSKWPDFSTNWNQYDEDGVKRIPVIKGVPYGYFSMEDEVTVKLNQSVDVLDLITNSSYNDDFEIRKSCDYNLDICNNTTDDEIASLEGTTITGLKDGDTTFVISNKHDGFITLLTVHVEGKKKVTFNANGGEGEMSKQTFTPGNEITLTKNSFTKDNYYFVHWNTKSDDTGTSYEDEAKVTLTDNMELFAIWDANTHYITFDANSGNGSMPKQAFDRGVSQPISPINFTKEYYRFDHWNTKSDDSGNSYANQQEITLDHDMTLYAIYVKLYYDVIYELYGGEGPVNTNTAAGTILEQPADPVRDTYIFAGWYTDESFSTEFVFGKPLIKNTTIYARWHKPLVSWNVNGGTPKTGFMAQFSYDANASYTLPLAENLLVKAPSGQELDAYEIDGARYLPGQSYTIRDNISIKILWKEKEYVPPTEYYVVHFVSSKNSSETVPHGTNLANYIANKKSEFASVIHDFENGKEHVSVDNYNGLFTNNSYVTFNSFDLKSTATDEEENTVTYQYALNYTNVNVSVEYLEEDEYHLKKVKDVEEKIELGTDLDEYISGKKTEFLKEVKDVDVKDLFVVDEENNTYQYATFVKKEKTDTVTDDENYIITNHYDYQYQLVTIVVIEKYTLKNNDYIISFKDVAGLEFEFNITNSNGSPEEFELDKVKDLVKDDGTFLDLYRISVMENNQELEEGPFEFKIKITDNMKQYSSFYMICVTNGKKEKAIRFARSGDYLVGQLEHLSDYALVGVKEVDNPFTFNNRTLIILFLALPVIYIASRVFKKKKHVR